LINRAVGGRLQHPRSLPLRVFPHERNCLRRASAATKLKEVVEEMHLPAERDQPDPAFHILNESYGITEDTWQQFE
jgi:hypothetical protein